MPTEDGDPVRARVPRAKLAVDEEHQLLLEQLVNARLVSIDGDTRPDRPRGAGAGLAPAARLARRRRRRAAPVPAPGRCRRRLGRDGPAGRASSTAAPGSPGPQEWRDRAGPDLNDVEAAFLDASAALAESEVRAAEARVAHERRVNRRLRGALAGVGVLLVMTMVAGLFAVRSRRTAPHASGTRAATRAGPGRASGQPGGRPSRRRARRAARGPRGRAPARCPGRPDRRLRRGQGEPRGGPDASGRPGRRARPRPGCSGEPARPTSRPLGRQLGRRPGRRLPLGGRCTALRRRHPGAPAVHGRHPRVRLRRVLARRRPARRGRRLRRPAAQALRRADAGTPVAAPAGRVPGELGASCTRRGTTST